MTVSLLKRPPVSLVKIQRTSVCTCHPPKPGRYSRYEGPGRTIVLRDHMTEWEHLDDATAAATHHCHVSSYGSDCDGVTGQEHVSLPNAGEEAGWEFVHWMRECANAVGMSNDSGTLTMTKDDDGRYTAHWHGQHDEGWNNRSARMCIDPDCAYEEGSAYDQFAEMMGY